MPLVGPAAHWGRLPVSISARLHKPIFSARGEKSCCESFFGAPSLPISSAHSAQRRKGDLCSRSQHGQGGQVQGRWHAALGVSQSQRARCAGAGQRQYPDQSAERSRSFARKRDCLGGGPAAGDACRSVPAAGKRQHDDCRQRNAYRHGHYAR